MFKINFVGNYFMSVTNVLYESFLRDYSGLVWTKLNSHNKFYCNDPEGNLIHNGPIVVGMKFVAGWTYHVIYVYWIFCTKLNVLKLA